MSLPAGTQRLFAAYAEEDLTSERGRALLIARLLEDGDAADLAWLLSTFSEPEIAAWLERHGGRQLSRRSRAFWQVVLGVEASAANPDAEALWPL
ncbi:MAG TPA: hypothetical protein VIE43_10150 [Thermoanaerobaculia bacterium]|nr:hypothetical protein [Thermoanaerobaculia bacterium]